MKADTELVAAAVAGDRQAAATLVERHAPAVYAVCLGMLADPDRAQDAAQDALLKAVSRLDTLRDPRIFRGWLCAIARNLCRDNWKQRRRQRELLERQVDRAAVGEPVPGMGTMDGEHVAEVEPDVRAALARLPEKHRLPLLLYYFDGCSSARVAETLGLSPGGVGARLCRARRALREILEVDHG